MTQDVVELLNDGIRMLFFNGVNDLICNHVGNEIAVENFQWKHQTEFQTAKRYGWKSPSRGKLGGYMKEYENLMYLKVLESGHMVPMDVPDVSLDMLRIFVFGDSFGDYQQDIIGLAKGKAGESCPVCPTETGCDICPQCLEDDSSFKDEENHPAARKGPFVNNQAMAGFAITALVLVCCACWVFGCWRRKNNWTALQYDIELPSGSQGYADDEEGEFS